MSTSTAESITCPRCKRTSYNPNDIREGYCGNCHDWTTLVCALHGHEPIPPDAYRVCGECGHCFNTREDLLYEDAKVHREMGMKVPDEDAEIYVCPLCTHDF